MKELHLRPFFLMSGVSVEIFKILLNHQYYFWETWAHIKSEYSSSAFNFDNYGSELFSFVCLVDVNFYLATGPHFCSFLLRVIIENHVISSSSHTFDQKSIEGFNQETHVLNHDGRHMEMIRNVHEINE